MEDIRKIRFVVPPFFLFVSSLFGYYFHVAYNCSITSSCQTPLEQMLESFSRLDRLIGILLTAGFAVIPLGYLIGTIPRILLELVFVVLNTIARIPTLNKWEYGRRFVHRFLGSHYEALISFSALNRIWLRLHVLTDRKADDAQVMRHRFYAVAAYDHDILLSEVKGVHLWLMRRWSSVNMSMNSIVAIWLPAWVMAWLAIPTLWEQWKWWLIVPTVLLALNGIISWCENVKMLEFQTRRMPSRAKQRRTVADT